MSLALSKREYVAVSQDDKLENQIKQDGLPAAYEGSGRVLQLRRTLLRLVCVTASVSLLALLLCCSFSPQARLYTMKCMGWKTPSASPLTASSILVFGVGIGDVSGPIVQTGMMGYAALPQVTTGLHIRQRSRAFVVGSSSLGSHKPMDVPTDSEIDPNDGQTDRWVFINSDICMGDTALRRAIVERLRGLYPDVYGERNIAFSGTHSHAGPGGYINALIPTVTTYGIVQETFNAIVDGTVRAVIRAHDDFVARREATNAGIASPKVLFDSMILREAHINRSPYSYSLNPAEERARYDSDQDDEFGMLRFEEGDRKMALLSFYPVHGTSLYENNTLSSGDNKGLAAVMVETHMDPSSRPGETNFVAGFSQSNVGDTTPNTKGAFCDSGEPCDYKHSTCKVGLLSDRVETCHGRGPSWGDDNLLAGPTGGWDWSSNEVIAKFQADAAIGLLEKPTKGMTSVVGEVRSVKWNVAMGHFTFPLTDGTSVTTCPAALGYGFAGGTTDGPGAFDFKQGANDSNTHNPVWDVARTALTPPSKEQIECQAPKRVLLSIGEQQWPYPWGPGGPEGIVETQILRAGNLFILVMPGEFTTMAGRRIKEAARKKITELKLLPRGADAVVMLSGPANTYGHYVTTREEYTAQRYEGGSTLFGPHTLEAYMHIYVNMLLPALVDDDAAKMLPPGKLAPLSIEKAYKYDRPLVYDTAPFRKSFGDVLEQPMERYEIAGERRANVTATFVAANPRNDLRLDSTYMEVQRRDDADPDRWNTIRTDGHHSTTLRWTQLSTSTGTSKMEISWLVEKGTPAGMYQLVYYGSHKTPITGKVSPFEGRTRAFTLV